MRLMYDAVSPGNIPADAEMVAGYGGVGPFTWTAADWARFPNAVKVVIVGHANEDGHVLDVEAGDATPDQAPAWAQRQRGRGQEPTVYCSWAVWQTVAGCFAAQGVGQPQWWIAAYPGIGPALYAGAVAHQYEDVGPYDVSVVADEWSGVDDEMTKDEIIAAVDEHLFADTPYGRLFDNKADEWLFQPAGGLPSKFYLHFLQAMKDGLAFVKKLLGP